MVRTAVHGGGGEGRWHSSPRESWRHADPPAAVTLSGDGADQLYLAARTGAGVWILPGAHRPTSFPTPPVRTHQGLQRSMPVPAGAVPRALLTAGPVSPTGLCAPSSVPVCLLQLVLHPPGPGQNLFIARAPLSQPCSRLAAHPEGKVPTGTSSFHPVMSV